MYTYSEKTYIALSAVMYTLIMKPRNVLATRHYAPNLQFVWKIPLLRSENFPRIFKRLFIFPLQNLGVKI